MSEKSKKIKPKVLILSTQEGDWEQLWINGELIIEGHNINDGDRNFLWLQGIKYGFTPNDIQYEELDDEDEGKVINYVYIPENLFEKYYKI